MKDCLKLPSLAYGGLYSLAVTTLAIPRFQEAGLGAPMPGVLFFCFVVMFPVGVAAVGWQHKAGMVGLLPKAPVVIRGLIWAVVLGCLLLIPAVLLDQDYRAILERREEYALLLHLQYPDTPYGVLASMLWTAGFDLLFFVVGAMAFFTRLTRSIWVSILLTVLVRMFVSYLRVHGTGLESILLSVLLSSAILIFCKCWLLTRFGLPAPLLLGVLLDSRHFFSLVQGTE